MPQLRRLIPTTFAAVLACVALTPVAADAQLVAVNPQSSVLVVGDSLAVGLRPYLQQQLGTDVAWDAKSGRTTPQGLFALRAALKVVQPTTVVVSLGTNDGSSPVRFKDRINRMLSAIGSKRCVVWTNIYRPARKGPYAALNSVLNAEASKLSRFHLVDWLSAVNSRAVSLPDGLHPNTKGFEYRSQLIADAVKDDCGVGSIGSETAQSDATGGVASPA
ncbi:GDSL-type esterase/lipase family protein [Baekduia sp. Peel2402]|uniref:GDSL-type esterase/lipase family protein n=1 Tax=Baekduia sp. Peel2402 TaxID=3458296 RepID=UPI00403EEEAF